MSELGERVAEARELDLACQEMIFQAQQAAERDAYTLAERAEMAASALWDECADDAMAFMASVRREARKPFTAQSDIPVGLYL